MRGLLFVFQRPPRLAFQISFFNNTVSGIEKLALSLNKEYKPHRKYPRFFCYHHRVVSIDLQPQSCHRGSFTSPNIRRGAFNYKQRIPTNAAVAF